MKRFEAGELDMNDDLPTEQLADLKAKFGDRTQDRTLSRHLLLCFQDSTRSRGTTSSFAMPSPWLIDRDNPR